MWQAAGSALLVLSSLAATAQTQLSGRVLAQGTHQPLPQVTVQATGQSFGTTTDAAGRFSLTLPISTTGTTLTFSHLGYQPLTVSAAQLGADVQLVEQSYLIGEVQISHVQLRRLLLRRWKLDSASVARMVSDDVDRWCAANPQDVHHRDKMYQELTQLTSSLRREYRDNGVGKTWGGISGNGGRIRWAFDEATRTINVEAREGLKPTRVLELTETRLVVQRADGPVMVWVPAEK